MSERAVVAALRQLVSQHRRAHEPLIPKRVVGRNTDGTLRLVRLDGECVERGDTRPAQAGQVLRVPSGPSFARKGASGIGRSTRDVADTVWVEKLEPRALPRGETTVVSVLGRGFVAGMQWDFLLPGTDDPHPGITVVNVDRLSSHLVHLTVTVAGDATIVTSAPLAYDVRRATA